MFFDQEQERAPQLEGRSSDFPFGAAGQPSEELRIPMADGTVALHNLWLSKVTNGGLPKKSDFKPTEMVKHISYVYIIDIIDNAKDFQVRLFGTEVADMLGKDYTGVLLSQTPAEINWRGEIYALACQRRQPVFYLFDLAPYGRDFIETENALFPLLNDKGELEHLLCISVRTDEDSML